MKPKILNSKKQIVILGGGFAGTRAALDLDDYLLGRNDFEITLVDNKGYQYYPAGLYKAAIGEQSITIPYAEIFAQTRVKFIKAYIDRIDIARACVVTDLKILPFDYLVIAMGSISDFGSIPNLDKYSFTLKSLEDARMIHGRLEDLVANRDRARIVIGGAGFAGVELAGTLRDFLQRECGRLNKDLNNFQVLIVEGGTNCLPGLSEKVSALVASKLSQISVATRFSSLITEVGKDFVILNMKQRLDYDLLIWTGGVRSNRLPTDLGLEYDKKDRILTTPSLNLPSCPNVFVAGDNLCFMDPHTKKLGLPTTLAAKRQGARAAKNIYRLIRGKPLRPYYPTGASFSIALPGQYAIYFTPNLMVSGFGGWLIRQLADLRYFLSVLPVKKALSLWLFGNKKLINKK